MKSVFVDTSVWVRHFRESDRDLSALLAQDRVWVHPFSIGEIACGTPPNRNQTIADLQALQQVEQARLRINRLVFARIDFDDYWRLSMDAKQAFICSG